MVGMTATNRNSNPGRGYFGIACYLPTKAINVGTLWRSARILGAAFLTTIGRRYEKQPSDTVKAYRHIPLFHFPDVDTFWDSLPYGCQPVAVEITPDARPLEGFTHPERAVYILGPENGSLPQSILDRAVVTLRLPGIHCLNLAVAGSIVMYDRVAKC